MAHDPVATNHFRKALGALAGKVEFVEDWRACLNEANVVVVATRWPEYADVASAELSGKVLFDARRMLTPTTVGGAKYLSIGRGKV
jgi:UDPglucose 6-dehydrogenase/GDP-mannose 6-dehydrogenase